MATNPFMAKLSTSEESGNGSSSSNNPFLSSVKSREAYRKKKQEEEDAQYEAEQLKAQAAEDAKKKADDAKSPLQHLQDGIGAVGGFLKDTGESIAESYNRIGKGTANVIGEITGENQKIRDSFTQRANDTQTALLQQIKRSKDPTLSQEKRDKARQLAEQYTKEQNDIFKEQQDFEGKIIEENDPTKAAGAMASIGLDIVTAGTGGAAIKGGKVAVEQTAKTVLKNSVEQTAKDLAKARALKLAKNVAGGAGIGASYGVTGTVQDEGANTKIEDVAKNAAVGAAFGGAVPLVGAGIKKGISKFGDTRISKQMAETKTQKAADKATEKFTKEDGSIDINAMMNDAMKNAEDKHSKNILTRVKAYIGDNVNPLGFARAIDQNAAKRQGIKYEDLPAAESLEHNLQLRNRVDGIVDVMAKEATETGDSFQSLAQKYKTGSAEAKEFANYTAAKYDLDRRTNGRQKIISDADDKSLADFVDSYEAKNPTAVQDLKTKNAFYTNAARELKEGGLISEKEFNDIVSSSDVATPFNRVFADKEALTEGAKFSRRAGSIAKQSTIKAIKGGDEPIDASLDVVLERVKKAVEQRIDNKIANKFRESVEAGDVAGRVFQEAGAKEGKTAARNARIQTNKEARILEKKVSVTSRQARRIQSELDKLNKEGMKVSLKEGGKKPLPNFTPTELDKLSKVKGKTTNSKQFFNALAEADPKKLNSIRKKIATREPRLAAKIDKIVQQKTLIAAKKNVAEEFRDIEVGLTREGTTGKSFISGLQDGQTFRIELPPHVVNSLDKLSKTEVLTILKPIAVVNQVFRMAWVGALSPGFAVKSAIWDVVMTANNSKNGFRTLGPKAVKASFKALRENDDFIRKLRKEGAGVVGSSQLGINKRVSAETLGATRSVASRIVFGAKNPGAVIDSLDVLGGKLASLGRTRAARSAYDDAIRRGLPEKKALADAAYAYNNVLPDFSTMSPLIRQINAVIPFTNASIAGTRSLAQAFRRQPLKTAAKVAGMGVTPAIAISAYSMGSDDGRAFYKDMIDNGNETTLDNNLIITLPGITKKDDKTGEWTGVIKIPITPEFRAINSQAWRQVYGGTKGADGVRTAADLFDFMTGGVRTLSSPLVDIKTILDGKDPRSGEKLIDDDTAALPLNEQSYSTTSDAGRFVGGVLNTSPIQGDKILGQLGLTGQALKKGDPGQALADNATGTVSGAYGERLSDSFYKAYTPASAKRTQVSKEVTNLVKLGKLNEARRKATEYNQGLSERFSPFLQKYATSDAYDKKYDDMMNKLVIKTSDASFDSRAKN